MVSTNTMRVLGRSAAATLAASVTSTVVTSMPRSARVPSTLLVLPNTNWLATKWSPALSKVKNTAQMPAMPVENAMVPSPRSICVILASSAAVVGVPWRE
ncbi:hypothetical protein D3C72_2068230 [compost metagenome]